VLYTPFCSVAKDVGFVEGDAVLLGDGSWHFEGLY
jgi:hypothetical protein